MHPPYIMLDARKLADGGIGVYIENLIEGFLELGSKRGSFLVNFILIVPSKSKLKKLGVRGEKVEEKINYFLSFKAISVVRDDTPKYSLSEYFLLPFKHREVLKKVSLYHAPHYTLPFFLKIPSISTIHDIIHVSLPDTFMHKILGRFLISLSLKRAKNIITVSNESKREILDFFKVKKSKINVIPNALRKGIKENKNKELLFRKYDLEPNNYFLFVGSDRKHKRLDLLLEVFKRLKEEDKKENLKLVVVSFDIRDKTKKKIKEYGLVENIKFLENVGLDELSLLYSFSTSLLIPSKKEGFGLMALEALACGTRIISTPLSSVREISGDLASYSKDFSTNSFYSLLKNEIENSSIESSNKKQLRIERSYFFTREEIAKRTLELYYKTLNLNFSLSNKNEQSKILFS